MSVYHIALGIAAIVAAAISYRQPRALLWIGCLAASFSVSVAYLYLAPKGYVGVGPYVWFPPAAVVAGLCDAAVAFLIYQFGRRRWETFGLYGLVVMSVAVNALYATGQIMRWPPIPPHETYAIILEAINYAALLLISGTAIVNRIGARHGHHPAHGVVDRVRSARNALQKEHRPSKALKR